MSSTKPAEANSVNASASIRPLLVHVHIFKNAGTSLQEALQRSFGPDYLALEPPGDRGFLGISQIEQAIRNRPSLTTISSHRASARFVQSPAERSVLPLVLLRDPLRRLYSIYRFYRQMGDPTVVEEGFALSSSFDDWLQGRIAAGRYRDISNTQLRHFVGLDLADEADPTSEQRQAAIAAAKELRYLGCVERVYESLAAWEYLLKRDFPKIDLSIGWSNSTIREEGLSGELGTEDTARLAADLNQYDNQLYRAANSQLDSLISTIPFWEKHLEAFKARCAAHISDHDSSPQPIAGVRPQKFPLRPDSASSEPQPARKATITRLDLACRRRASTSLLERGDTVVLTVETTWTADFPGRSVSFAIYSSSGQPVMTLDYARVAGVSKLGESGRQLTFTFEFPLPELNNDLYRIDLAATSSTDTSFELCDQVSAAAWFAVGPPVPNIYPGILTLDQLCEATVSTSRGGKRMQSGSRRHAALILHHHIFKNAGATIEAILRRNFGSKWHTLAPRPGQPRLTGKDVEHHLAKHPEVVALSSQQFAVPLSLQRERLVIQICMLRHPLDRLCAIYQLYRREIQNTPVALIAKTRSLPEFAEWLATNQPHELYSPQVTKLAHSGDFTFPPPPDSVDKAWSHIQHFAVLGTVDTLQETLSSATRFLVSVAPGLDLSPDLRTGDCTSEETLEERLSRLEQTCGPTAWAWLLRVNSADLSLWERARIETKRRYQSTLVAR